MDTKHEVLLEMIIHRVEVQENLAQMRSVLKKRGIVHDKSKFTAIEFDAFVSTRPKFSKANYGTTEYQECVDEIKPAIDHHYSNNRHHPGFFKNGFANMNLFDILEMLADWKAASNRSPDLSFLDSLPIAFKKYSIPENMQTHIMNTLASLGWI